MHHEHTDEETEKECLLMSTQHTNNKTGIG